MTARPKHNTVEDGPVVPLGRATIGPDSVELAHGPHGFGDAWVIVELAPDAVMVIDEHGGIELANHAAEIMFGYDRQAMARVGVDVLIPGGRRAAHSGHWAAHQASPQSRPLEADPDLWARRANGSEFPVEMSLSTVIFGHGARVVAIIRDVTDHRAAERDARDLLVLADEERIGAAMHHGVIGRLFAAGLTIQAVVHMVEPQVAQRLLDAVDELDRAIHEIRDTVIPSPKRSVHPAT